ncbi:MAG TPA: DUF885 domain-containing protein [Gammaproteobacteria bacterium]|nr:DUF885 domain-containing protein [Gammaproteobacteria bacterium]
MQNLIFAVLLVLVSCPIAAFASSGTIADAVAALHKLFDEEWERGLREDPLGASYLGDRRYNDRWPDVSLEAIARRHAGDEAALAKLAAIDAAALPPNERLNYELFRREYENRIAGHRFRQFLIPLNQRGGIQTAHELTEVLRFSTVKDYEDWLHRLETFGGYLDQTIALMRQGIREKRVPPKIIMQRIPSQIALQIVDEPEKSLFYAPFRAFPDDIPPADRERLAARARAAIAQTVVPAFRRFQTFFNDEYLPACRDTVGAWDQPEGREFYAFQTRLYTTTNLTPDEIHDLGLREVARIRGEMQKIIEQVGFRGSFQEFLTFLRTDPRFYYTDPNELYEGYLVIAKKIDPEVVKLFRRMPRMPYGVRPIPMSSAPDTTTAYYQEPAMDGSRAGYYYVNLYKPETRPKYEMEVLTVHEAVPGHHFQVALAQELGELPKFRRFGGFTAFVEGWGLYAESLGDALGLYRDPYSKFGQLTYEMWRAVRLVVDTGMHHKGWTREQAIEFFKANAAKTEHDIVNEIDRYIAWPGQALAYKIGELKIKELRARAERELGDQFDIRDFHDVVLGSGAIPLDMLERHVEAWLAGRRKR